MWLRDNLPPDAMICNGAGNYSTWIHRFYRFRRFATQLAPISGSMGYGVPAAVAMKRLYPDRVVVALAGDGDFLMNGQEFATAVQYDLPIIIVVCDNGIYGTIRMHQEREYPGRISATELRNPDFAAYATRLRRLRRHSGTKTADFPAAFAAAQKLRQAGDHPPQDRSGSDHAADHAGQDPREVAVGAGGQVGPRASRPDQALQRLPSGRLSEARESRRFKTSEPAIRRLPAGLNPAVTGSTNRLDSHPMAYRRTERVMQRLAARHDAIIIAACAIAAEAGMGAVQIAPVAERAGIAAGTVYRYFPAKADLVAALVAAVSEREIAALRRAARCRARSFVGACRRHPDLRRPRGAPPQTGLVGDRRAGRCGR